MKKSCIPFLLLIAWAFQSVSFAAGSITCSVSRTPNSVWKVTIAWVGDTSDGSVPASSTSTSCTSIMSDTALQGTFVVQAETIPSSPAPTNTYAVTIKDPNGVDIAAGQLAALSSTVAAMWSITAPPLNGVLTFALTGNSVHSAAGTVILWLAPGNYARKGSSSGGGSGITSINSSAVSAQVIAGTANQITVTSAAGTTTLSFPAGGVTLPGTTTGTFSGAVTGNASTATALAANGANCTAGNFPLGVDASGASESCTALPTTLTGTANQIAVSGATGAITLSIPTNPTLPGTTTGTFSGNLTGNASGSAGTVTSIASHASTELSDTASLVYTSRTVNTTSPITGGGALSADRTFACATCVASSSPGVGLAHFAGSTQAVTSSLVVNADITNSTIDVTSKITGVTPAANGGTGIANSKTLTVSNNITLAGADAQTYTFPTTSATIARTDAANTFTGVQTMTSPALTTPTITTSATLSNNGIAAVVTDGQIIQNTTPAISGTQQFSPALTLTGDGWKTTSTAGRQAESFKIFVAPQQSSTTPIGRLVFDPWENGAELNTPTMALCPHSGFYGGNAAPTLIFGSYSGSALTCGSYGGGGTGLLLNTAAGLTFGSNGTDIAAYSSAGVQVNGAKLLGFCNGACGTTPTVDTGFGRNTGGVVEINSGTLGTYADIKLRTGNYTGLAALYNNVATAGMGVPPIYASASQTAQTATIGATNLQCGGAVCPAGLYRVHVYDIVTTTGTGTLTTTIGWTDPGQAQTLTSVGIATTAKNFEQVDYVVRADGIANITYATTLSVSGTYSIYVTLERLQ